MAKQGLAAGMMLAVTLTPQSTFAQQPATQPTGRASSGQVATRDESAQWQERTHLRNSSRRLQWNRPRSADFDKIHRKSPTYLNRSSAPVSATQPKPLPKTVTDRQVRGASYVDLGEGLPLVIPEPKNRAPEPFPIERQQRANPIRVIDQVPAFVPAEPTSLMAAYQDDAGVFDDADLDALVPGDDDLPPLDDNLPEFDEGAQPGAADGIFEDLEPLDSPSASDASTDPSPLPPDEVLGDDLGSPATDNGFSDSGDDLEMLDDLDPGTEPPSPGLDDDLGNLLDDLPAEDGSDATSNGDLPDLAPSDDGPTGDLPLDDLPGDDLSTDDLPGDDLPDGFPLPGDDLPSDDLPSTDSPRDDLPGDLPTDDLPGDDIPDYQEPPRTKPPVISPSDRGTEGFSVNPSEGANDLMILNHNGRDCPAEAMDLAEAWLELRRRPVRAIDLDITPSLEPNKGRRAEEAARAENLGKARSRTWRNKRGEPIAEGKMTDFRNGHVYVDDGGVEKALSYYELSNPDLCFVTAWWELPGEYTPNVGEFEVRNWTMISMTWKASGLCHKPLYFEEVALERYGHSAGPVKQVALSGAHFFGSIFFLPYNMGVAPPTECKYSLGYYRPGSCAPWLVPAVPLSARGARWQLGAVVGGLTLLP